MSAGRDDAHTSTLQLLCSRSTDQRPASIQHLPLEIIHLILVFSGSDALPSTSRHLRQACRSAGVTAKAEYILARWFRHFIAIATQHACRSKRQKHAACVTLAGRIAALEHGRKPQFGLTDCNIALIREHRLDLLTFAAEFDISSAAILERVLVIARGILPQSLCLYVLPPPDSPTFPPLLRSVADNPISMASCLTSDEAECLTLKTQLPKRLFRRIDNFGYLDQPLDGTNETTKQGSNSATGESRPRKRRKRRKDADASADAVGGDSSEAVVPHNLLPVWLSKLMQSLASPPWRSTVDVELKDTVGPVPSAEDLHLLLFLLLVHRADASSHQGYPLAMAVHRQAFALAHLLLLFGADPNCKQGLAAQIAIRGGSRDLLHLLVVGPHLDEDSEPLLSLKDALPKPTEAKRLKLDQTHLRLAIQSKQRDLVDYIWHEQGVFPDMACLRLIETLR